MFKILILAIFLMGNAFGEFNISNIKLTPTELEIVGDGLQEIKSVAFISNDSRKDFEIDNVTSNQVIASPLDNTTLNEWRVYNLVISDSEKESTYPITISQKNGLITFYKLQEKKETPVVNSQSKMVLDQINFVPGENNTGYDYNYSLYANPTGDFAIKGIDKDLFTIDNEGNVEISGTLKIKGKQIGFNIPYLPIKEQTIPSNSANKVVFSSGDSKGLVESGYTIPMNICPKGQILKSDGINFVCSLEASQEDQLGPVYTGNKSNLGIDQIYRELQINNVIIDSSGNINGVLNFSSTGNMNVAAGAFVVDSATRNVGIGATPTYKLEVIGAVDSGILLKQAAQSTSTGTAWKNGLVFGDTGASTKAVGIGYGVGDLFSVIAFDGTTPRTVFTLNSTGNAVIPGNLKIGAYTLPSTDGLSGTVLKTNGSGTVTWAPASAGNAVDGPATSTVGNIASWNNTTGSLLTDGGKLASDLVTNAGTGTAGFVATFSGGTGKVIQNGTKLEADLVTGPASASATNNLASFNGLTGKIIQDSGISSTNVMTMASTGVTTGNILTAQTGTKSAVESTVAIANVSTMAAVSTKVDALILSAGTDKTQKATAYSVPNPICPTGQIWKSDGTNMLCSTAAGGDVTGPAGPVIANELAVFADTTGKVIRNVTTQYLNLVTAPADFSAANRVALTNGALGKTLTETTYTFPVTNGANGEVLKINGSGVVSWQPDVAVGTNTVQNLGTSTDNAIPRFNGTTGKEIENSVLVVGNAGELTGVTSINGKTAAEFVTLVATPTGANFVYLSNGANTVAKTAPYTMPSAACTDTQILKANASGNFVCTNDSGGVASFNSRTGVVVPIVGDYTASIVGYTPTGAIAASTTQGALNELDTEKLALAGGTMTGTLTTTTLITTAVGGVQVGSPGASTGEIHFMEASAGPQYVGFKSPANLTGDTIWVLPPADGASGTVLSTDGAKNLSWKAVSGGDVTGPASSTANNITTFSDGGGKIIKDSGILVTNVVIGPASATATSIAIFNGATGKLIQSSPVSIDASGNMTGVGNIGSSGNLTVNGTLTVNGSGSFSGPLTAQSYTNTSDRMLKKDITPFSGGDLIDKLMPVTFRWKKGDDRPVIGLIAQDVEKVLPDVITVTKTKDGSIRSYDVGQVLALTIEALKETRAEVKKLQEKIKKLEQKKR